VKRDYVNEEIAETWMEAYGWCRKRDRPIRIKASKESSPSAALEKGREADTDAVLREGNSKDHYR